VGELWGMSEMFGGTLNPPERMKLGTVGPTMPGVELRVAEDGELLIKGEAVMRGYRNEPEKTAEAIDADGWLHTGDIGEIDGDGYVTIVDRKKELIISAGGKNMSPANIENTIRAECGLVGAVIAIGDRRPYNVALITLDPDALAGRAPGDEAVLAEVEAGMQRANARLARVEQIKKYKILPGAWQPGGEELTPTMKLKRKPIAAKYAAEIDALYADR
jgi:long-chain acyl-CoA synthetase